MRYRLPVLTSPSMVRKLVTCNLERVWALYIRRHCTKFNQILEPFRNSLFSFIPNCPPVKTFPPRLQDQKAAIWYLYRFLTYKDTSKSSTIRFKIVGIFFYFIKLSTCDFYCMPVNTAASKLFQEESWNLKTISRNWGIIQAY